MQSDSSTIRVQKRLCCMTTVAVLECKSGSIAEKSGSFTSLISLRSVKKTRNPLCINALSQTPKTQEFRTKDFVARRAHSIEHQKCKYCIRQNRVNMLVNIFYSPSYTLYETFSFFHLSFGVGSVSGYPMTMVFNGINVSGSLSTSATAAQRSFEG